MRRSVYTENDARFSLAIATRTNGTVNGTAVDAYGYRTAMVVALSGTITDGSHALTLQDSDDGSTGWANVADVIGSVTLTSPDDNIVAELGGAQFRRYLRVVATTSGATTGGNFGALIVLGTPRRTPVTH